MVENFMTSNKAPTVALTSNSWQGDLTLPLQKFSHSTDLTGFRAESISRTKDEKWLGVSKD